MQNATLRRKLKIFWGGAHPLPKPYRRLSSFSLQNFFNGVNDQILENKTKTKVSEPPLGGFNF